MINSVLPKPKNNVYMFLVETGDTHLVCHLSCHGSALLIDWGKGGQGWVSTKGLYASGILHYYITPVGEEIYKWKRTVLKPFWQKASLHNMNNNFGCLLKTKGSKF